MTNSETRMSKESRMTNDESPLRHSGFVIHSSFWLRHWSFALALLLGGFAHAQSTWVLTTADFKSERVTLVAIDAQSATVSSPAEQNRKIDLDRVLMLD